MHIFERSIIDVVDECSIYSAGFLQAIIAASELEKEVDETINVILGEKATPPVLKKEEDD